MKLQFKYDYIKYERSIVYLSLLFSKSTSHLISLKKDKYSSMNKG